MPFRGVKAIINKNKELLDNGDIITGYIKDKNLIHKNLLKLKTRYYKTGDVAQRIGKFYFCSGRVDSQVKQRL